MTALLVALGAAVGAPARLWATALLDDPADGGWPRGTLLVNVLGSLALGALVGAAASPDALALLGVGFCGAFTTYSAFAVQTVRLGTVRGAVHAVVTLLACVGAATLGFALA